MVPYECLPLLVEFLTKKKRQQNSWSCQLNIFKGTDDRRNIEQNFSSLLTQIQSLIFGTFGLGFAKKGHLT